MPVVPISRAPLEVHVWKGRPWDAKRTNQATPAARRGLLEGVAVAVSIATTVVLWLAGFGRDVSAQTKSRSAFWTGQLAVTVLRCNGDCGPYATDENGISRHAPKDLLSHYTYNVYQNDKEVVRRQLLYANTGGVNEQARDAQIVNYAQGYVLGFDPGVAQALRRPLVFPNTTSTPLETRKILGFKCNGVRRTWVQQRNGFRNVSDTWTAADSDFRDPLFEVVYGYDAGGHLGFVQVSAVQSIKPSPPLEPSLFELPAGMGVLDMGNP